MVILGPIIVVMLMAVAVQSASCAADPYVSFTKTVTPVSGQCNQWDVTVNIAGVGTYNKAVDVVLVMDESLSMADGTRMADAKTAATTFTNLILGGGNPYGNRIAFISFSSGANLETGFTSNLNTILSEINELNPNGYTNTEAAINMAGGLIPASPPCDRIQVVVFFSDGVPTYGTLSSCSFSFSGCNGYCSNYNVYPCSYRCCQDPTGPNCCTNGAIYYSATAKARANVYSIGLVTGMSPGTLSVARAVFNGIQDSGYFEAPTSADLQTIFAQIAGQLQLAVTAATVLENLDSVGTDFDIVGTITTTAGTATPSGNTITWNGFNVAFGTPATMTYRIAPKSGVCGDQILGGSSMTYTTVTCTSNTLTATAAPTSVSVTCLTAAISPDPAVVCNGSTLQLNGNPLNNGQQLVGSYTHAWTGDTGFLSATNIQNPVFSDKAPAGSYSLTYTVTNSTNGCFATDTITVTVRARPTASIAPTSVCEGTALQLDGNPSGGSGTFTTHLWTGDTTHLSATNIQNPVLSATAPAGTYSLAYTVTDSNGCIGIDTETITVHSRPTASITPDPAEVCEGSTLQLNGNPSGGSGSYTTHLWTGDTAHLSSTNIQNPVLSATAPADTYSLTYTVTDSNGCIGTDMITVKVGAKPTVVAGPDQAICIEDDAQMVTLTATATDYDSIHWTQESGPGTFEPGSNDLEIIFHPDYDSSIAYSETEFKVQAIAQSPCTGTETASDYVKVMVSMKPETDILVTF